MAYSNNGNQLNDNESSLIQSISENNLQNVIQIVSTNSSAIDIDCKDEHGMSPLQHACYKGNLEIAKFLLERGADVNQNDHEHRYTCLMFAALGGHLAVINLLLEYGANIHATNTVGRTASQMAAFVGQHQSVAVINNYLSRDQIEYYNKIQGQETEPRLAYRFIQPVHSLVCIVSVNPIRICFFYRANYQLFEDQKKISIVLEHLCGKLFRNNDPNEMMSLKIHYLNFIFQQLQKSIDKCRTNSSDMNYGTIINKVIKFWLKPNQKGFSENMERLLREAIRSYAYQENSLFQQLIRTLSAVQVGEEPATLSILSQTILGKAIGAEEINTCFTCSEMNPIKRCSRCKTATYCDETCQRMHWQCHKIVCTTENNVRLSDKEKNNLMLQNNKEDKENVEK